MGVEARPPAGAGGSARTLGRNSRDVQRRMRGNSPPREQCLEEYGGGGGSLGGKVPRGAEDSTRDSSTDAYLVS